ncbi:unnamed protein product [Fusarium graminearum]|uniref:Chromosome 4, complete genome n=1 Tax=Gibberella zeae (strain ATCC MYA-4620 / CBS 123657 / FGSC 9075 / NRRL 31084 / PH-1) TaxID=229533 RepID=A0A098DPS2_GIBZE|nr:unnamed protein product [Fusarium graminearum]CZS72563.1 unnamed protein product [Fusarium graminearum]
MGWTSTVQIRLKERRNKIKKKMTAGLLLVAKASELQADESDADAALCSAAAPCCQVVVESRFHRRIGQGTPPSQLT